MANLFVVFLTLLAIVDGTLLSYCFVPRSPAAPRFAMGAVAGLTLLAWLGFLTSLPFGLGAIAIGCTTGIFLLGLAALAKAVGFGGVRAELREIQFSASGALYYTGWAALLVWLFSRVAMFYPDGLHTAPANNFGDLPFHFGVITSFAYGENLPPQSPLYAGLKFTYPYLIDFLTAFYIRTGADWRVSFFIENIALAFSLVILLTTLTREIFQNRLAGVIAPVIFLFNGGLGFLNFFRDLSLRTVDLKEFLLHLPNAYTMNAELTFSSGPVPLRWGNVFTTLLLPQRSMLFGLPIVAMILIFWWRAVGERETERRRDGGTEAYVINGDQAGSSHTSSVSPSLHPSVPPSLRLSVPPSLHLSSTRCNLLAAGLLAGLLPMLHAHGFFSVMIASVAMALVFFSKDWLAFFIPAGLLSVPQALYLGSGQVKNELFKFHLWWEAGDANPLVFWLVNDGLFLVLLIAAMLIKQTTSRKQIRFYLPFALWFLVPNLVLLAPWAWDSIKMFVYWSLISAPFVAVVLAWLFSRSMISVRILAAAMLFALTLSGLLDVARALSPIENVTLYGKEELEVADLLRQRTPPRALILHAPIHNSVVTLSGRQPVMGYPGHLWTHGIPYQQREAEVKTIYEGGPEAANLLAQLGVDYVLIGPSEQADLKVDDAFFVNHYPIAIDHGGYRVFQIRP
jgi:hypothetical protein